MFEHNHIPELVQEILRGKALAAIVESATVKDASGNVVELKNLRPDGTIGEPAEARGRPRPPRPTDGDRRADATRPTEPASADAPHRPGTATTGRPERSGRPGASGVGRAVHSCPLTDYA